MVHLGVITYGGLGLPKHLQSTSGVCLHRLSPEDLVPSGMMVFVHVIDRSPVTLDQAVHRILNAEHGVHWVIDEVPDTNRGKWALKAGAQGYSSAPVTQAEWRSALALVQQGQYWASRTILNRLVRDLVDEPSVPLSIRLSLSPREREVAECVASGYSNKRIARQLEVTERTVKAHLSNIFQKTPVSDRLELALLMKGELPERVRVNL